MFQANADEKKNSNPDTKVPFIGSYNVIYK